MSDIIAKNFELLAKDAALQKVLRSIDQKNEKVKMATIIIVKTKTIKQKDIF
jgi:hypothetical protein